MMRDLIIDAAVQRFEEHGCRSREDLEEALRQEAALHGLTPTPEDAQWAWEACGGVMSKGENGRYRT